jgi:methyltransferase (TIGR00027 family)
MQSSKPSETALRAAELRAAHQILDNGTILEDPLAMRILGTDPKTIVRVAQSYPFADQLRWFMVMRSRVAEDALAAALAARGTRQFVVLGAGLDTYAYRNPLAKSVRVFEVDHPSTQLWKRQLLSDAAIPLPETLTFVPVQFENTSSGDMTLADALIAAGFDPNKRTFFSWLGVVVYLSEDAIFSTLRFIASLPGGAEVVFDYRNPVTSHVTKQDRSARDKIGALTAGMGETSQTFFDTDEICAKLTSLGFRSLVDFGPKELAGRFLLDSGSAFGGHVVQATT